MKRIVSFNKLTPELKKKVKEVYEYGFEDYVQHVKDLKTGKYRKAIPLTVGEDEYLIMLTENTKSKQDADENYDFLQNPMDGSDFNQMSL